MGNSINPNRWLSKHFINPNRPDLVELRSANVDGSTDSDADISSTRKVSLKGNEISVTTNTTFKLPFKRDTETQYQLIGRLPAGVSFDSFRGEIKGTPTEVGFFRVRVKAQRGTQVIKRDFNITVNQPTPEEEPEQILFWLEPELSALTFVPDPNPPTNVDKRKGWVFTVGDQPLEFTALQFYKGTETRHEKIIIHRNSDGAEITSIEIDPATTGSPSVSDLRTVIFSDTPAAPSKILIQRSITPVTLEANTQYTISSGNAASPGSSRTFFEPLNTAISPYLTVDTIGVTGPDDDTLPTTEDAEAVGFPPTLVVKDWRSLNFVFKNPLLTEANPTEIQAFTGEAFTENSEILKLEDPLGYTFQVTEKITVVSFLTHTFGTVSWSSDLPISTIYDDQNNTLVSQRIEQPIGGATSHTRDLWSTQAIPPGNQVTLSPGTTYTILSGSDSNRPITRNSDGLSASNEITIVNDGVFILKTQAFSFPPSNSSNTYLELANFSYIKGEPDRTVSGPEKNGLINSPTVSTMTASDDRNFGYKFKPNKDIKVKALRYVGVGAAFRKYRLQLWDVETESLLAIITTDGSEVDGVFETVALNTPVTLETDKEYIVSMANSRDGDSTWPVPATLLDPQGDDLPQFNSALTVINDSVSFLGGAGSIGNFTVGFPDQNAGVNRKFVFTDIVFHEVS